MRFETDKNKSGKAHQGYRNGYRTMYRTCPDLCKKLNIPAPDSFSKSNGQDGVIWGWKKECTMTNLKAGKVLLACYRSKKLTLPMLDAVRKSLAYSYQLMGHEVTRYKKNWSEVYNVWNAVNEANCKAKKSTLPVLIPTPEELKDVFTRKWDPNVNEMPFLESVLARRSAFDIFFSGHRPNKDISKIKKSVGYKKHEINVQEGWMWSAFEGGRSKLAGAKKNSRPWRQWARCWCEGGRHVSPTLAHKYKLDDCGNPVDGDPGWDDRCIIAGFEFTCLWFPKKKWRRYPNLKGKGRGKSKKGQLGDSDIGSPVKLALKWFADMGQGPYDTNSGRKAYARLLDKLNICYEWGFENHGDGFGTWEMKYQQGCRRENDNFSRRTQSKDPRVATRALIQISQWMGLGTKQPARQMSLVERQNDMILRMNGFGQQADMMLLGLKPEYPKDAKSVKPEDIVKPESVKREEPR